MNKNVTGPQQNTALETIMNKNDTGPQQNTALETIMNKNVTGPQQNTALETIMNKNDTGPQQNTALETIMNKNVTGPQQNTALETIMNKNDTGPQQNTALETITPGPSNLEIKELRELLNQLAQQGKIPPLSDDNNELRIVNASSVDQQLGDQDQQLGDQDQIEVDLSKGGKQLNITYLTTDNEEKTIKIVLNGPQTNTTQGDNTPIQ
jgi:molybdopterin converting factor small subunit